MQPVRSCEGPVPPRVSSVPTRQTLTQCLQPVTASVRAIWTLFHLNPVFQYRGALLKTLLLCDAPETLSRRSSVRTLPADHFCSQPADTSVRRTGTVFRWHRRYQQRATFMQPQMACERHAPPRASTIPTRQTLTQCSQSASAYVRGACTQFRRDRLCRPCGTLTQPLLECVVRVPPAAIVVCTDPVGHSLSLGSL